MRYKRYDKYKDSGVEWIGEVPEHWVISKLKLLVSTTKGYAFKTEFFSNEGLRVVKATDIKNGTIIEGDTYINNVNLKKFRKVILRENDIIMSTVGSTPDVINSAVGQLAKVPSELENSLLNQNTVILRVNNKACIINEYMFYLLFGYNFRKYLDLYAHGTANQASLSLDDILRFPIGLPDINEQLSIVNYLNDKVRAIDILISDKQNLISLLKEHRQSIINEAVIKGLNPNVKMKDSGVDWIGEVPEHWEIKKLKHLTCYIGSGKTPKGGAEVYEDDGILFIRSQNVHFDGLKLNDKVFISKKIDEDMRSTRVNHKDILLNITGASIGRASLAPVHIGRANVNQHVCIVRSNNKIIAEYLYFQVCSKLVQDQILALQKGTSREGINFEQISNFYMILPKTFDEQVYISTYIQTKTSEINSLISDIELQIAKIKEYRQSLIFEAVTGKIDLRDYK